MMHEVYGDDYVEGAGLRPFPARRSDGRLMDTAYTYSARGTLERIAIYAPPAFVPPLSVTLTRDGDEVLFVRLSDVELLCGKVPGVDGACRTHECHRTP